MLKARSIAQMVEHLNSTCEVLGLLSALQCEKKCDLLNIIELYT
jgi:hypothetical protein